MHDATRRRIGQTTKTLESYHQWHYAASSPRLPRGYASSAVKGTSLCCRRCNSPARCSLLSAQETPLGLAVVAPDAEPTALTCPSPHELAHCDCWPFPCHSLHLLFDTTLAQTVRPTTSLGFLLWPGSAGVDEDTTMLATSQQKYAGTSCSSGACSLGDIRMQHQRPSR